MTLARCKPWVMDAALLLGIVSCGAPPPRAGASDTDASDDGGGSSGGADSSEDSGEESEGSGGSSTTAGNDDTTGTSTTGDDTSSPTTTSSSTTDVPTTTDSTSGSDTTAEDDGTDTGSNPPERCGEGAFDAEVLLEGGTWVARNGGETVYSGADMRQAMQAGVDSLTPGRAYKEKVIVRDSGSISGGSSVDMADNTIFESCGVIEVTGSPSGDNAVVRGRGVRNVDVTYLSVTGNPWFGVFFRESHDIHLGQIDLRLSGGLGIRIDHDPDRNGWGARNRSTNISIDDVYVEGTNNHGVETYGVDGLTIGTVTARNTAYSGLLLNATSNAEVGVVDGVGAGTGTGYATFRMANQNGRVGNFDNWTSVDIDNDYTHNIHVGVVRAEGGGRGIFCVSGSGGAIIDRVELRGVGTSPAVFVEDCFNVTIGSEGGIVERAGASHQHDISITARGSGSEDMTFLHYSAGIVIENLELIDSPIYESNCDQAGNPLSNIVRNNTLSGSMLQVCSGTDMGND